jgi:hypothetical protein
MEGKSEGRRRVLVHQGGDERAEANCSLHELIFGDNASVEADSFPKIQEVGRGIEADTIAGFPQDGVQEGGSGSLSIGPSDQDRGKSEVRIAECTHQRLHIGEPQFDAKFLQGE